MARNHYTLDFLFSIPVSRMSKLKFYRLLDETQIELLNEIIK